MLNSLSPTDHERLSRLGALAVCVVAAAICLYLLVRLAWLLLPRHADSVVSANSPAPVGATVSVAKWHLFGNPQGVIGATPASTLATVLKLGLRGTLALPDPKDERAIAIIANEQGIESSVKIGDDVAPGARLAEVYADHVVLDHQGVAETLPLPRPDQHAPPLPAKNQQNLANAAASRSMPPGYLPKSAGAPAVPGTAAAPAKHIDPQEFARQIRPVFSADGKIVGADISGADAGTLARVGLKPNDVVTAINGMPLTSVSNPQALMAQLQNSNSIQVTVQRDGKPATLTLSLR
ncbi:MAG TPA: type II secretion system protein N [Rudaea sp.]|jgi:general secretion pathway protein C